MAGVFRSYAVLVVPTRQTCRHCQTITGDTDRPDHARQGQGIQNASGGHCRTRTDGARRCFNDADDTDDSFGKV